MSQEDIPVRVLSMFGARTQLPLVTLVVGDKMHQMSPNEARRIAGLLFECAEAAEGDAFLVGFMKDKVGLNPQRQTALLQDFRAFREREKQRDEEGN